jgi:predicted metal-binding membrane protein
MPNASRQRQVLLPALAGLALLAWAALWGWSLSPHARYLEHAGWLATGPAAALCRALPAGALWLPPLLHALAWVLMTLAMMLPTTLPLFDAFDRMLRGRADRHRLLLLLGLGYLAAWGAFGLAAHALHEGLQALLAQWSGLARHAWVAGAATVALAGAFQFSALKRRCLDKCRAPMSFVVQHWRGRRAALQAWRLGAHHGLYCVGCCWALMLLMFVVGMGNLGWMMLLALLMALEKNLSGGRRLSMPLGLLLLGWAAALVMVHL